jgi:hypothetical protein
MSETTPKPLLNFTVHSYTANELAIKVKNISGTVLDKTLSIEMNSPLYLLSPLFNDALEKAPFSRKPTGAVNIGSIVSGPDGWTVWLRRETSDSSVYIVLFNDLNQAGDKVTPVKVLTNAEFTIRIPLDPDTERGIDDFLYSYQHGTTTRDPRFDNQLELKFGSITWTPDVSFTADSPMMVKTPGDLVTIFWEIKDGVSATLRGPLPGGNPELPLSTIPGDPFQMSKGFITVRVVGSMTFVLQAEVTRPNDPNFQVVKMLSFDTPNHKYLYVDARPNKVLPYGLVEIDWAAWGVDRVTIEVGTHTTRVIPLTQQTLGRFYEGTGVMRISATKSDEIDLKATAISTASTKVKVLTWDKMDRFDYKTALRGMAINGRYMALLTAGQLYHGEVGDVDPEVPMTALPLVRITGESNLIWQAITALANRFVCMRRNGENFEVVAFTREGKLDVFPPLTLPPEFALPALSLSVDRDFVSFGERAYLVAEAPLAGGIARRAYSIGFNSDTKKVDYRHEPVLERLIGYRLVVFDQTEPPTPPTTTQTQYGNLYALNRTTGDMLRFDLKSNGTLDKPVKAAPAIKKDEENGNRPESMITNGLIVPVGHVLVVFNPTCVPSVASLEQYGLKNTLKAENPTTTSPKIPQDLFYNPQKNYWGRCGRDPQTKGLVDYYCVGAFRRGDSPRLWVLLQGGDALTLAVGEETVFAHDYRPDRTAKTLAPPVPKKSTFTIKCAPLRVMRLDDYYRRLGFSEFATVDPVAEIPAFPRRGEPELSVNLTYDENDPAPVTIQQLVERDIRQPQLPGLDYVLEVTLSGENLSNATSCYRRVVSAQNQLISNDVVDGSRTTHKGSGPIEVPVPKRFVEEYKLVVVNTSKNFSVMTSLRSGPKYILNAEPIAIHHKLADFSLVFQGKVATPGVITVNLNFALPDGIEQLEGSKAQTKLIRLNTDNAQKMRITYLAMLRPGDEPLRMDGAPNPIEPMPDRPVYVCQLYYDA